MAKSGIRLLPAGSRKVPIRWDKLPHQELWQRAHEAMELGSLARASSDALRSVLKRRLGQMDREDHRRYIEIECSRIVETLRAVRDTYREFLKPRVSGPLAEMYWVVCRFGVRDWAVMRLRSATVAYILDSQLPETDWDEMFGFKFSKMGVFGPMSPAPEQSGQLITQARAEKAIEWLIRSDVLERVLPTSPFSREYQYWLARMGPKPSIIMGEESFLDILNRRLVAWDNAGPWMEGLGILFDVTQAEVMNQFAALSTDGLKAETAIADLSDLERIAHKHLSSVDRELVLATAKATWSGLLKELDKNDISPSFELKGTAKKVLASLRRKGHKIETWAECYDSVTRVTLNDDKVRTLRRETTHSLHNAAKRAEYRLQKVWGSKAGS